MPERITLNINDVVRKKSAVVIVTLKGMKVFRFRLWLAARIIKFGAWVARDVVEVKDDA